MEIDKVNKAQGMYPTPVSLVKKCAELSFSRADLKAKYVFVEPGAGTGNFVIGVWEQIESDFGRKFLTKAIASTICFENHLPTFRLLQRNIESWLANKKLKAKPVLVNKNFLTDALNIIPQSHNVYVVGNPPWDEYTTRKHDDTQIVDIKKIRDERQREHSSFKSLGHRNVYQSFMHVILQIKAKKLKVSFVLPRQVLGDKSSATLRKTMLDEGIIKINSFKNKDNSEYEFECVDKNFEIVLLNYTSTTKGRGKVLISRGLGSSYFEISAIGDDYTIPCPHTNEEIELNSFILNKFALGDWVDNAKISISMGKVKHYDLGYKQAMSGRTITPYGVSKSKNYKLVINKILPNSVRKIKAALVSSTSQVNESLVEISCDDQRYLYYLYLMLNSKVIDSALRSLVSNINLNIFRLLTLPIPEPDAQTLLASEKLVSKIQAGTVDPNQCSRDLTARVMTISGKSLAMVDRVYVDHNYINSNTERVA